VLIEVSFKHTENQNDSSVGDEREIWLGKLCSGS